MGGTINNPGGYVGPSSDTLTAYPEVSGIFDVMWFEFEVVGYGTSNLDLRTFGAPDNDMLAGCLMGTKPDGGVQDVPLGPLTDAYFDNTGLKPAPYPPIAVITEDKHSCYVGETISLSAASSVDGFDGNAMCPVTAWAWEIDGVNVSSTETYVWDTTGETIGGHTVKLYVYAAPSGSPEPGYDPWDTDEDVKTIFALPTGRDLDLTTQDYRAHGYYPVPDGTGPDQDADEFQPQEWVILYANVTYNGDVVQNKLVAFEIYGPINAYHNVSVFRTAATNSTGCATVGFRIPWPCDYSPESIFGTWTVLAKVDIAKIPVWDTLNFTVHYIVEILNIVTTNDLGTPLTEFKKCDYIYFNITVHNWAMTDRNATITVVVYDELGVPIGVIVIEDMLFPSGTTTNIIGSIHVPKWAFIGVATAYANAYTCLPTDCGVPWCPEVSTSFAIVLPP